jgi:DNA-binding response OmpR family regulator
VATPVPQLNIVLVEDHDILRHMVKQALEEAGHQVVALSCAEELEDEAHGLPVDVFLIDLNLPGEDGLSLTERVRSTYPLAGLIVITARSSLKDKLEGYARGADLYLSKPVEVPELCAAVAALGRRRQLVGQWLEQQPGLTLSQQQMTLSKNGQSAVSLSAAESAILITLARAPGQRAAYWQIAETLGLDPQTYAKASLEVRIVRLRKKLVEAGAEAGCIEAVRGHGYQLCTALQVV